MKVLVYSSRDYDQTFLKNANRGKHDLHFIGTRLEQAQLLWPTNIR